MSSAKFCSDHFIQIWIKAKQDFYRIWITMAKSRNKMGPMPWNQNGSSQLLLLIHLFFWQYWPYQYKAPLPPWCWTQTLCHSCWALSWPGDVTGTWYATSFRLWPPKMKQTSLWWLLQQDASMITTNRWLNPLRAKFLRENINNYLHFMSFLHTNKTHVVEIPPRVRQGPAYST